MGRGHGADTDGKNWNSIEKDGAKLDLPHVDGAGSGSGEAAGGQAVPKPLPGLRLQGGRVENRAEMGPTANPHFAAEEA